LLTRLFGQIAENRPREITTREQRKAPARLLGPEPSPYPANKIPCSLMAVSIHIVIVFPIPIALLVPAMFFAVPPAVILIPTSLALGIQGPPPVVRLRTARPVTVDRFMEFGLSGFDFRLALCPAVSM
jgi:hypothetical protein